MSSVRKFIAVIIVLSLGGLSTAWAYDTHIVDPIDHQHTLAQTDTGLAHDEADHDDDHCCHLGIHLIGIRNVSHPVIKITQSMLQTRLSPNLFVSLTTAPPLRPPQS
ncbi:MAG: hypothetical protein N0C81_00930 [Candidatus Thiodiazotropha lotti]|nr:hypothetical protein [Candidatus Thiodiazotropha lotti]MCG7923837.1 hypothetical protein [Candidatus Thiodiazotropha lotti]MCG7987636.1 hypothetical protein [Candidatus Thiodiazotropha lotti]MCG8004899.1 hypothetical protein [Candidatus Thiodiazotropha lotti]MCG8006201.1 hypothetical protein [Candidatus Thiodiazotropha lotti]